MTKPRPLIELVHTPIELESLQHQLDDPDVGAHAWFLGVTRRLTEDRITTSLAYEAHEPMAIGQLQQLAQQAIERFGLRHLVIVHRLGDVPVGEASVAIGCSSPHRIDCLSALPWIMDLLKREIPIWKRESFADGTTEWVHPEAGRSE